MTRVHVPETPERKAEKLRRGIESLSHRPSNSSGEDGAWQTPTLLNSYAQPSAPYEECAFRLAAGDKLEIRGHLDVQAATPNTVAFVLPAGHRLADLGHDDQFYDTLVVKEDPADEFLLVDCVVFVEATSGNVILVWDSAILDPGGTTDRRCISFSPFPPGTANTVGDGKAFFLVPAFLNGYRVASVDSAVGTVSSSGTVDVQIRRRRSGTNADVLTTKCTIDANEETSLTGTAEVVNTANDDLATGDILFVDVDAVGTGSQGLTVSVVVELP